MQIGIGEWKTWNGFKATVACHRHNAEYPWVGWLGHDGPLIAWNDKGQVKLDTPHVHNLETPWTSPIASGHNPDKLTEEQAGVADGWRLPEWGEIDGLNGENKVQHLEYWSTAALCWRVVSSMKCDGVTTYRTKLSREELAVLRKPKMRTIRVEELPPVCWVKTGSLVCLVVEMDSATQTIKAGGEKPVEIKMLRQLNAGWSSDLRNWNPFEVEDKQ